MIRQEEPEVDPEAIAKAARWSGPLEGLLESREEAQEAEDAAAWEQLDLDDYCGEEGWR